MTVSLRPNAVSWASNPWMFPNTDIHFTTAFTTSVKLLIRKSIPPPSTPLKIRNPIFTEHNCLIVLLKKILVSVLRGGRGGSSFLGVYPDSDHMALLRHVRRDCVQIFISDKTSLPIFIWDDEGKKDQLDMVFVSFFPRPFIFPHPVFCIVSKLLLCVLSSLGVLHTWSPLTCRSLIKF